MHGSFRAVRGVRTNFPMSHVIEHAYICIHTYIHTYIHIFMPKHIVHNAKTCFSVHMFE